MKRPVILLILIIAGLISCQTKAEIIAVNPSANAVNIAVNPSLVKNAIKIKEFESVVLPTPKTVRGINAKVGIVDVTDDQKICFETKNANLTEKTSISIITSIYNPPQKVLEAVIENKLEKSCVSHDSDAGESNPKENSHYTLTLTDQTIDKSEIEASIGVVQRAKQIKVQNELASVDLTGDGKPEFFRICASSEGLHLTIWTGKPLTGKRIWHHYYYLHYDTEADCKEKDWEGTDD